MISASTAAAGVGETTVLRRIHRLLWSVRVGRCGALARASARALRLALPVRGIGPLTNIVLGAPSPAARHAATATIDGVAFELDLSQALHRAVYLDLFSIELRRVVLPLLGPGDLFVDVGANFGFWALPAARRGCRVIAVEPVPSTRALLAANATRNGLGERVEIVAAAVSDSAATLVISVPGGESGQASAHPDQTAAAVSFDVAAMTLDQLVGEQAVRFLKIDVEGHEPAVLRGGQRVLGSGQIDYVLIELASAVMTRSGGSAAALIDVLEGHGYAFVRFVRANEGLFPRRSYGRLTLEQLRTGAHAGDALWARRR
jgi:FkbM family methyltransferase